MADDPPDDNGDYVTPDDCAPDVKAYRIYPEDDFNVLFGNPPSNVITS